MYKLMIIFHIITSCIFMLVAITLSVRSIQGWLKNLPYTRTDKYMATFFLMLLYLTLINGIIMYFFIDPSVKSSPDIQHALKRSALRFWVVEHFYSMTFALILSQIGGVFIRKTNIDKNRFAYATFYYGTATLITIVSMAFYLIYR